MSLLKYQFTCQDEEACGKSYLILVDPDEPSVPDVCPFCGSPATETDDA